MKRRIFLSLVLIALISAVIAMLVTGFFYFGEYEKRARFDLRQQLSAAAEGYRTGGEAYIRSRGRRLRREGQCVRHEVPCRPPGVH